MIRVLRSVGVMAGLCVGAAGSLFGQTGSIEGRVRSETGEGLARVEVILTGTSHRTLSGEDGRFFLAGVPAGEYALVATRLGYEPAERSIDVGANVSATVELTLGESAIALQEVEVIGRRETSYKSDYSFAAAKVAIPSIDIPQSISAVTKEVMADRKAYRLGEVVKNVSGVNQFSGYDDLTMRGFRNSGSNGRLINGLRSVNSYWSQPITPHLERVEVIKGPASALFGNANPGGTVNMVTKKPLPVRRQALSFTVGSYDAYRVQADFTGPVNAEGTLLYRVNVGYENAGSFRDQIFNETVLVAPSVSFLPSEPTRVNVDLVYGINNTRLDRGQAVYGTQDLHSTPTSFSLSQPSDHHRLKDFLLNASISHQLMDRLTINASYMKSRGDEDLAEHRTSNQFRDDTTMIMLYGERKTENVTDNLTTYVVADLETGPARHRAMLGFDYITVWGDGSNWGAVGSEAGVADFILTRPSYTVRRVDAYTPTSSTGYGEARGEYSTYGAYVQDQMSLGRLKVLVGLRRDEYTDRLNPGTPGETGVVQTALIPRLGAVYGLGGVLNLYGNYSAGFEPVAASYNSNPIYGGPFDPERSNMIELGAKGEFFDQRLTVTAAAYQIVKTNVLVSANSPTNPDELRQRGRERARGFEVDVAGSVTPNLSLIAHYALNRTIILEDADASLVGQEKENALRQLAGAWAKYQIGEGPLAGIGFGAGFHHVADRFTFERADPGAGLDDLILPGYSVFDAALYYNINNVRLAANLNNLTDETYWVGGYASNRIFPGAPRSVLVSVGYSF